MKFMWLLLFLASNFIKFIVPAEFSAYYYLHHDKEMANQHLAALQLSEALTISASFKKHPVECGVACNLNSASSLTTRSLSSTWPTGPTRLSMPKPSSKLASTTFTRTFSPWTAFLKRQKMSLVAPPLNALFYGDLNVQMLTRIASWIASVRSPMPTTGYQSRKMPSTSV